MTDKTETELLPVTQEDHALYKKLFFVPTADGVRMHNGGYDHYREMQEIARHRINSVSHLEQALDSANRQLREAARQLAARPTQGHEALVKAVMASLWPVLGGNHTSAEAWHEINDAVEGALANLPTPQAEAGLVEQIAQFVANWSGETRDGDTFLIADEIREMFGAQPQAAPDDGLVAVVEQWRREWLAGDHEDHWGDKIEWKTAIEIARRLTALRARPSGDGGWRPIETAPKDGTWIIAWDGEEVLPLAWDEGDIVSLYEGWCYGSMYWGGTLYEGANEARRQPTHWQPLPEPPARNGEAE